MSHQSGIVTPGCKRLNAAGWISFAYALIHGVFFALELGRETKIWEDQSYAEDTAAVLIATIVFEGLAVILALVAMWADLMRSGIIKAVNIMFALAALGLAVVMPMNDRATESPWLFVFIDVALAGAAVALALHAERPRRAAAKSALDASATDSALGDISVSVARRAA